jgi:hypothetical protein
MDIGRLLSEKGDEIRAVASRHGACNKTSTAKQRAALREIERLDKRLSEHFDGRIVVQPNGKGNSSQQMGEHGREALRKCVYVWQKPPISLRHCGFTSWRCWLRMLRCN